MRAEDNFKNNIFACAAFCKEKIMHHKFQVSLYHIILCLFFIIISNQIAHAQNQLSANQWREDLKFLAEKLPQVHRNAFHNITQKQFEDAVEKLDSSIPTMKDHEIIVGFAHLVAMIGDGHSRLSLPLDENLFKTQSHTETPSPHYEHLAFGHYPIKLYLFSDGLYIKEVTAEWKNILGARIIKIGSSSAEEALETARSIIHYDNEMWFKLLAPSRLVIPEVLHALRLIEDMEKAPFVVELPNGKQSTVYMKPLKSFEKAQWIDARENASNPTPLYLRDVDNNFWFEHLADKKTLYVQINKIQDKKEESLAQFCRRVFDFADAHTVDRFILDIRLNDGGNNYLNRSLILALIRAEKINQYGKLFTIIGRGTFSAAMNLASDLEHWTNTIFVGEPTGSTTSHYGDSRKLILPNSGLTVRLSTVYWRDWSVSEKRPWIAPDIRADLSFADYQNNNDPALQAIFAYTAKKSLAEQLGEALSRSGTDFAYMRYYKFKTDPAHAHINTEKELDELGHQLLKEKQIDMALAVFSENANAYPDSCRVYRSLGEAYLLKGDDDQARKILEKALTLNPEDAKTKALLKKLKNSKK
jgi:tetratricopeptide (TPR) repeat protein